MSYYVYKNRFCYFIIATFILFSTHLTAQTDTIFFNSKWKTTTKDSAVYYRIKPIKIKTKKAIGHKIQYVDSLYLMKDYYVKNNALQFEGYTKNSEGNNNVGKAKWFNEDGSLSYSRDFNKPAPSTFRVPIPPMTYFNYSVANKSLLTAGLEFCLDCEHEDKLFLGIGYGITNSYNGNYYGLPDLHLSYNKDFLFLKAGSSHKNAYVLGGFTFLNLIDLGFGYSFSFNKDKIPTYKGFTTSISLRLSKSQRAYQKFNVIQ